MKKTPIMLGGSVKNAEMSIVSTGKKDGQSTTQEFFEMTKVKISEEYYWAKGVTGRVVSESRFDGLIELVWVRFDKPQIDSVGDGPYTMAEIDMRYLEKQNEQKTV